MLRRKLKLYQLVNHMNLYQIYMFLAIFDPLGILINILFDYYW